MGAWNNPVIVPAPQQRASFLDRTGPSILGILGNLALAKMQHNWNMDIAEKKIQAAQVVAQQEQKRQMALETKKGEESRKTAKSKAISEGKLVRVPDIEAHTLPPAMQQQLVSFEGGLYAPGGTKAPSPEDLLARSTVLRKEFAKGSQVFVKVRDSFQRIRASAKDPTAAGDLSMIFNYMKMLDPESVVRESEFATAANAAGVPDRIRALYNKVVQGKKLAPAQRQDFLNRAQMLMARQRESHGQYRKEYERLAKEYQVPAGQVLIDYRMPYEVGAVYEDANGVKKRYLGIDKGWEPVQ